MLLTLLLVRGGFGVPLGSLPDPRAATTSVTGQGWKLLSCSQRQELGQRANLAFDWLPENKEPIRCQVSFLSQLFDETLDIDYNSKVSTPEGTC